MYKAILVYDLFNTIFFEPIHMQEGRPYMINY